MKTIDSNKVSAVIPTRDRVTPLRRALMSLRMQTRQADEIIVVDDGSKGGTRWLREEFPEIRCIEQSPRGVSAARNRGLQEASGGWIAFLDSDDEWLPQKLDRQITALQENPDYLICHTDEIWIRRGRRVNPKIRHEKGGGLIFQRCLPLCVISPSSVIIRRSLLDEVGGFDETLPVCEDYDLWLRICCRHPVLFLQEPLVVKHGGHPDQLSKRFWGMDRFRIQALTKILESGELSPQDRQATLDVLLQKIGVYLQGARKRSKSREVEVYEAIQQRVRQA
ncbi:MAG: glycosyltransferase family 2 protein [Candidatus Krumholzibacteria bacterium]|nr:glycosyltransferase family 2 protein [Candidatus Krumholzibacteria bacterium]